MTNIEQKPFNPVAYRSTIKQFDAAALSEELNRVNTAWREIAPEQRTVGVKNVILQNSIWAIRLSQAFGMHCEPAIVAEITPNEKMDSIEEAIKNIQENGFRVVKIYNSEVSCKLILILEKQ